MSTIASIMCLIFGVVLAVLEFTDKFKYKTECIIVTVVLLVATGAIDIILRNSGAKKDKEEIVEKVEGTGESTFKKIDTSTNKITENSDANRDKVISSIPKMKPVIANKTGNQQTNKDGGSGIQNNNSPNYGQQAGGDIYNVNEKQLTLEERGVILLQIKKLMTQHNLYCIGFTLSAGSNGGKFLSQLQEALIGDGYDLNKGFQQNSFTTSKGISYSTHLGCLNIIIGTF